MAEVVLDVEVAYAAIDDQVLIALQVPAGTTALQAVERSGIASRFPAVDLAACPMGIFSRLIDAPAEYVLAQGDRVEIYRPLQADPKEVRRMRAAKAAKDRKPS